MAVPSQRSSRIATLAVLSAVVLTAFWPVLDNGFTSYDDGKYVTGNPWVRAGVTFSGLGWAWTTGHASNWHPLTWMSHMLDWQLFGANAAGHHATSLLLHVANTLLLFVLLERATGAWLRSATVAALFGLHPLHVESVAWVAERKDVLSTLFWLLASLAYLRWARAAERRWLWVSLALLVAGLCAKPMLVTLPLTLLLWDVWPLGRWRPDTPLGSAWSLVREKVPMLAVVALSSAVTLAVQQAGRAVVSAEQIPLAWRVPNALVSYVAYLGKTLWPRDLAVFYPHPLGTLAPWKPLAAAGLLGVVTVLAWRARARRPYVLFGWLWYLVTLVPVIGLVQVGTQAMADRYTYVPLIGIFVVLVWAGADAWAALRRRVAGDDGAGARRSVPAAVAVVVPLGLLLALATRAQVGHWRDSESLFRHALAVTENNAVAHNNLGTALFDAGHVAEAVAQYRAALEVAPDYPLAHSNLGFVLAGQGRLDEALHHCREALRLAPRYPEAHNHLGLVLARLDRVPEAVPHYEEALRLRPEYPEAHNNLGAAHVALGRLDRGIGHYRRALELRPGFADARRNLAEAYHARGLTQAAAGRPEEAIRSYREAVRLAPRHAEALNNLGGALTEGGRAAEGLRFLDRAVEARPGYGKAHSNRAAALLLLGRRDEAARALEQARRSGFEPPERLVELISRPPGRANAP